VSAWVWSQGQLAEPPDPAWAATAKDGIFTGHRRFTRQQATGGRAAGAGTPGRCDPPPDLSAIMPFPPLDLRKQITGDPRVTARP